MSNSENLVVIHLSATAVYVVIGQVISVDDIKIMGVGEVKSEDFQQGKIKSRERLKSAIRQAVIIAEEMANCRVHSAWLTLSTPELVSKNSFGKVQLQGNSVEARHIVSALTAAKEKDLPNTHYVMHHCQQGILIDEQADMVDDAIEMHANELTVMYHLMMMPVVSRQNIQNLIQSCDIRIDHMLFDAVSTAEYGLIDVEREQGVCLIDIGASTTSICVYRENKLIFTHCFTEGSHKVTMDISAELGISMIDAEKLKKRDGNVDSESIDAGNFITHHCVGVADEVTVGSLQLTQIIEARYELIFNMVRDILTEAGLFDYLQRGFVLAGGGSQIEGIVPFAKRQLKKSVVKTNKHPAISAYNHMEPEKDPYLLAVVQERALQTAFGALLYSQSEQFKYSEKSSPEALKTNAFKSIKQTIDGFFKRLL